MKKLKIILTIGLVLGLGVAWAVEYNIQKPVEKYGNLIQGAIPPPLLGASACGPTAAVNSFVYLEQQYPGIYGRKLVPDTIVGGYQQAELIAVAQSLAAAGYMNTMVAAPGANTGTYDDMFIYGKYQYIEDNAPGTTLYSAQLSSTWGWGVGVRPVDQIPPIEKPDWVDDGTIPTWQFLFDELVACEDVEILIVDEPWGHFLTLTSFSWTDTNDDGIIQQAEGATIDYIDPVTGGVAVSPIKQNFLGDVIWVNYSETFPNAQLVMAVAESPVPEPAELGLIGIVVLAFGRRRRM